MGQVGRGSGDTVKPARFQLLGFSLTCLVCFPGLLQKLMTSVWTTLIVQELCESRGGRPGLSVLTEPSGFRGRKDLLHRASALVTNLSLICHDI